MTQKGRERGKREGERERGKQRESGSEMFVMKTSVLMSVELDWCKLQQLETLLSEII